MPRNGAQKPVQGRKRQRGISTRARVLIDAHERFKGGCRMPTLTELMLDRAEMDVLCDLGSIRVVYRPRVITPAWQKNIGEREEAGDGDEVTLFQPLRDTIVEWDLDESPGSPFGLDDEDLSRIPRQILNQVLWSLMTTARPNQNKPPALSIASQSAPSTRPARMTKTPKPETNARPAALVEA